MQDRGHGRLDRMGALGGSNLKRVRRTVPPDLLTFNHTRIDPIAKFAILNKLEAWETGHETEAVSISPSDGRRAGFTIIELLIVVAVIGILAGLVFGSLPAIRERSMASKRGADLRQIVVAMVTFSQDNGGYFPVSGGAIPYGATDPQTGQPGWQEQIEPYIENNRRLFAGPEPEKTGTGNFRAAYFSGSSAGYLEALENGTTPLFQPVKAVKIQYPSRYILAGEIRRANFQVLDADPDNFTQEPAFDGGTEKRAVALAFADGHIGMFYTFDPGSMMLTYAVENP